MDSINLKKPLKNILFLYLLYTQLLYTTFLYLFFFCTQVYLRLVCESSVEFTDTFNFEDFKCCIVKQYLPRVFLKYKERRVSSSLLSKLLNSTKHFQISRFIYIPALSSTICQTLPLPASLATNF